MKYQVGQRVTGKINNITDLGIFLTLPGRRSGLIHHSDFENNWLREKMQHKIGDELRVVVVHNYKGRLGLSLTRVNDPQLVDHTNQFSGTKKENFEKVMNQTVADAVSEIKHLKTELEEY